jgi:HNH endonuclease
MHKGRKYKKILVRTPHSLFLHYSIWPDTILDHCDGDKTNNNPANLRLATKQLNAQNSKIHIDNALGVKGVYRKRKGFRTELTINSKTFSKNFPTLQEAIDHRKHLEKTYHPWAPTVV